MSDPLHDLAFHSFLNLFFAQPFYWSVYFCLLLLITVAVFILLSGLSFRMRYFLNLVLQLRQIFISGLRLNSLLSDYFAIKHFEDSMTVEFQIYIMSYHNKCYFLQLVELSQDVQYNFWVFRVKVTCGLIKQQHFGPISKCSSYCNSLLFSTRQLVRVMSQSMAHSHRF